MKRYVKSELLYRFARIGAIDRRITSQHIEKARSKMLSAAEAAAGEKDEEGMRRAVAAARSRWPEYYDRIVKSVERELNGSPYCRAIGDQDRLKTEMLFDWFAYGFSAEEFVCYEMHGMPAEEKQTYMSGQDCIVALNRMNRLADREVFNNKGRTYARFRKYYQRDGVYISAKKDFGRFREFADAHPVFVKKAVFEAMGRSVELMDMSACGMTPRELFDKLIAVGPHLLEERVIQTAEMASLNASSVNTVRCITFNTRHGLEDPYYFIKIGRAGSFVDNGGAGGILVGIDRETGCFMTDGFDEMENRYESHPDSGVRFKGFQLPEWEQMKRICLEMSAQMPGVKFIGWDMAHTEKGWVLIEGNGMGMLIGPQAVFKRGIKKEVEAYMADMDLKI
ncbi:MAG: hypothetical protein IJK86_08810 [Lachnospiraceae bacterium]|nr:hypothetical protein [Lachnospiraceae bacterium]